MPTMGTQPTQTCRWGLQPLASIMGGSSLKICHVNVRSLLAACRLSDLEILCASHGIDVLRLTETLLSPSRAQEGSSCVNLPGFQPPYCDRIGHRGGGVAVYVCEGLHVVAVDLPSQLEAVGVEIHSPKRRVCILAVYRPPSGDLALSDFIRTLDSA